MRKKMRSIRNVTNESAALSDRVRLTVKAHFDLGDPQNIVDGTPDLKFTVGDLGMEDNGKSRISIPAISRTPLVLPGGAVQTTMRLSGPSAFTLISVIKEVHISKSDVVA